MRMGTIRSFLLASVSSILFAICDPSHAALYNRGGGLIYDDVQNITWLQDANYADRMTWAGAMTWAENLTYFDLVRNVTYSDWRLPKNWGDTCYGFGCSHSEMGTLYYLELGRPGNPTNTLPNPEPFLNVVNAAYWTSTPFWPTDGRSWIFTMGGGGQAALTQEQEWWVWAVRDGDVSAVPEPQSYCLILAGLLLMLGVRTFKQ